jgi:hypothetical protein
MFEKTKASDHRVTAHDLAPIGTCIHVTVPARLVAEFPNVDLEHGDFACS